MLKVYALLGWTNVIMACVLVVFQVNTKDEKKQETEYMYFYRAKLQTFWTHYGMNYATTHKYKHTHTHSLQKPAVPIDCPWNCAYVHKEYSGI